MRLVLLGILLTGCTLFESGGGGPGDPGGDDDGSGGSGSGAGPVGRTFVVQRSLVASPSCGFAEETRSRTVSVSASSVTINGASGTNVFVNPAPVQQTATNQGNVRFTVVESWVNGPAFVQPAIRVELWVDGPTIVGIGQADVNFDVDMEPIFCSYTWELTGS